MRIKICLVLGVFIFSTSCSTGKNTLKDTGENALHALVENYFESYLKLNPLFATSIGDHRFDDQLTIPISEEIRKKERALTDATSAQLKAWGCKRFTGQDFLTCEVLVRDLKTFQDLDRDGLDYLMPFNQFDSFFSDFAELASGSSYVEFNNATDYQNFMKRMEVVPLYFDVMIANMKMGVKKGITTPQVLVDQGLKQIRALTQGEHQKSVFYKPLHKLEKVTTKADAASIRGRYEDLIKNKIYPAYQKLEKYVRTQYRPNARKSHGISALPGGRRNYTALAKYHTTTDLTPDQIMSLGLGEVKRIRAEFEDVKNQLGFDKSLADFFKSMRKRNAKLYPFKTAQDVLSGYQAIHKKLEAQVTNHFRLMPKAPFEIREVEKIQGRKRERSLSKRERRWLTPGYFWVPVPNASAYSAKDMESLFLHEAIPGHHFQISIQQELNGLPRYRRFNGNNAYVEGWALYTESLGRELGLYTDPHQWVGRLSGEMHRAVRLVVDTGIHWKGWSREKAIQFSQENEPADLAGITAEIERYMAIPGQALSYKLGELKIQQLKRAAREALGLRYSDRDFHDEILKDGALPLSVLEDKINRWIEEKRLEYKL